MRLTSLAISLHSAHINSFDVKGMVSLSSNSDQSFVPSFNLGELIR